MMLSASGTELSDISLTQDSHDRTIMQRNAIHFILNYLTPHLTLKDRDQNRKSVESLYLLLVPLIEASRIAHHRRTSNAEAHASI